MWNASRSSLVHLKFWVLILHNFQGKINVSTLISVIRLMFYWVPKVEQFSIDVRKFTTIALILPNSVLSVIGPELLSPPYRPIGFQTKTNHDLVARVFPRFVQFACFYSEFKLANDDVDLRCDWQRWLLTFWLSKLNWKLLQYRSALALLY